VATVGKSLRWLPTIPIGCLDAKISMVQIIDIYCYLPEINLLSIYLTEVALLIVFAIIS